MEIVDPKYVRAYDSECIGCNTHKKDVMIAMIATSISKGESVEFIDIFLTQEQAYEFHQELSRAILNNYNNKKDKDKDEE